MSAVNRIVKSFIFGALLFASVNAFENQIIIVPDVNGKTEFVFTERALMPELNMKLTKAGAISRL
jgi:hypothetical protein